MCGGAPQDVAPAHARSWVRQGRLSSVEIVLALAMAGLVAWAWFGALRQPCALGAGEIQVRNLVSYWDRGELPYHHLGSVPVAFNPYGPVHTWLASKLTDASSPRFYLTLRALSVAAVLVLALVVGRVIRMNRCGPALAWLVVLLLPASRPIFVFGCLAAVDLPAVALSVLGFELCLPQNRLAARLAGVASLVVAFHVKATSVAAPLAMLLAGGLTRRDALALFGLWLAGAVGGVIWLQVVTDGAYLENLCRGCGLIWRGLEVGSRVLTTTPFLVGAVVLGLNALAPDRRAAVAPFAVYFVAAWLVAIVFGANWGSSWQYLAETHATGVLLLAALVKELSEAGPALAWRRVRGLLVVQLACSVPYLAAVQFGDQPRAAQLRADYERALEVLRPTLARGEPVIVVGNDAARDAVLALGGVNPIDLPGPLDPFEALVAVQAMSGSSAMLVLSGPGLVPLSAADSGQRITPR